MPDLNKPAQSLLRLLVQHLPRAIPKNPGTFHLQDGNSPSFFHCVNSSNSAASSEMLVQRFRGV